ncbi:response regulator transcription factor [Paenibacillus sp. FSL K6-1230]|uniref:response regulator transcription factor n=1 Tax=Paenibacillus sp. FSL K6-1230 TaxID=2921603 RepID=UPI0003A9F383
MPEQANQVTSGISMNQVNNVQQANSGNQVNDVNLYEPLYCPVTSRITLISPVPAHVQTWISMLSASCYDVMVFHRWEPQVQGQLTTDLLVLDCTSLHGIGELKSWYDQTRPELEGLQRMLLVTPTVLEEAGSLLPDEELLAWPASANVTISRVEELISRLPATAGQQATSRRTVFKDIWIDQDRMTVQLSEQSISLTKTEYDLLLMLIEAQGRVISREQMMKEIWDTDFAGGSNVVDVHVKSLRKKLGDSASAPKYIATIRGAGYRLAD